MMTDQEIIDGVRSGKILKYVGRGLVILNYDWWQEMIKKDGFKPVPTPGQLEELVGYGADGMRLP